MRRQTVDTLQVFSPLAGVACQQYAQQLLRSQNFPALVKAEDVPGKVGGQTDEQVNNLQLLASQLRQMCEAEVSPSKCYVPASQRKSDICQHITTHAKHRHTVASQNPGEVLAGLPHPPPLLSAFTRVRSGNELGIFRDGMTL